MESNKEQLIDPERILYCIAFAKNHAASKEKQIIKIKSNPALGFYSLTNYFKTFITNGSEEIFFMGIPLVFDNEIDGVEFVLGKL